MKMELQHINSPKHASSARVPHSTNRQHAEDLILGRMETQKAHWSNANTHAGRYVQKAGAPVKTSLLLTIFKVSAHNSVTLAKAAWSHTEDKSTCWTECLGSPGVFSLAPSTCLNCNAQIRKVSPTKGRPFSASRNSKDPRHLSFASVL